MLLVRAATEADVLYLAPRLRPADLREIHASGYKDPVVSLMEGLRSPDGCYVATTEDDLPLIIGGTSPSHDPLLGYIWMMASTDITKHWVTVLRSTETWTNFVRKHYRVLTNAVHEKNTLHIKWLRWSGFVFLRRIEVNGEGFYEFAKLIQLER